MNIFYRLTATKSNETHHKSSTNSNHEKMYMTIQEQNDLYEQNIVFLIILFKSSVLLQTLIYIFR
jgi:hypothetical protein